MAAAPQAFSAEAGAQRAGLDPARWKDFQSALVRFADSDLTAGFQALSAATSGFAPERLSALESFCAGRARVCAPLRRAQDQVKRLNQEGLRAYEAGADAQALRDFNQVLAWLPAEPAALAGRRALSAGRDAAQGLKQYAPAAGLDARDWDSLGVAFSDFEKGDWQRGFRGISDATREFRPERLQALRNFCAPRPRTCSPWRRAQNEVARLRGLGVAAWRAHDAPAAARHLADARRLAPFDAETLAGLAQVAAAQGEMAEARRLYDEALQRAPKGWPRAAEARRELRRLDK